MKQHVPYFFLFFALLAKADVGTKSNPFLSTEIKPGGFNTVGQPLNDSGEFKNVDLSIQSNLQNLKQQRRQLGAQWVQASLTFKQQQDKFTQGVISDQELAQTKTQLQTLRTNHDAISARISTMLAQADTATPSPNPGANKVAAPRSVEVVTAVKPVDQEEYSKQTPDQLIEKARKNISANTEEAVIILNNLMLMPPNPHTEEAAELIGDAYSSLGKTERAKVEYAYFLATYPESKNHTRVKHKLLTLEISAPRAKLERSKERQPDTGSERSLTGGITEYYYAGSFSDEQLKWKTTDSSVLSSFRLNGMMREGPYVGKAVLRLSSTDSFIGDKGRKEIYLGYLDFEDTFTRYSLRFGRQNQAAGALGRFDGVSAKLQWNDFRFTIAGGIPDVRSKSARYFYGGEVEWQPRQEITTSVYYNGQMADGLAERSAVGGSVRFFKNNMSLALSAEYDILYSAFNSTLLNGSVFWGDNNIYFMADRRKSPVLYGDRILSMGFNREGSPAFTRIQDVLNNPNLTPSVIYDIVAKTTPDAATYMLGVSRPISKSWTVNTNLQVTNLATVTAKTIPPLLATQSTPYSPEYYEPTSDNSYAISNQLLGTDVFRNLDSVSLIVNQSWGRNTTGTMLNLVNTNIFDKLKTETYLSYIYRATRGASISNSFSSSFRAIYSVNNMMNLEALYSIGIMRTNAIDGRNGPNATASASRSYPQTFYIGIRYDF